MAKTTATKISHKIQEHRPPSPYLGIIPKKVLFFECFPKYQPILMSLQLELEGYHSSRTNMNCGLIDKDHCKFLLARSHILGKGVCVIHTGKFPIHNHLFCFWSPCNSTLRCGSGGTTQIRNSFIACLVNKQNCQPFFVHFQR